ncbi:thiol-disulfide oxidoreductase ResA [bacterium BMS3Abin10]|nr:thiol-disulfide oxidoreductase ResA [bacterium BMS3Abin10]GBE37575.1 thiol-disulfide oxidoreductase ResA [bacterium BMS3Bbin08]
MKYKGPILVILIIIAVAALIFLPERHLYMEIAEVNSPAPDFELSDSNGKIWKLSDLRGKVVFINFWATWCTTCKGEMPYKEALYEKMKDKPFQMFGVLFRDDPANLVSYFKKHKVSFPTLISPGNEMARLYGITGVPETFIIDKEGIIREKLVGPRDWGNEETMAMIEKWL